jgi:hypothetical protein
MNRVRGFAERLLLVGALGAAYLVSGCKKKEKDHSHGDSQNPSDSAWVEIAHEHSPRDAHVHVYALLHRSQNGQVYEGYNRFRIKVEGYSGTNVKLVPIMYMSTIVTAVLPGSPMAGQPTAISMQRPSSKCRRRS